VAGQSPLDPQEAVRRAMRTPQRKRFYASAGVVEADRGFAVTLDGKPIRTPSGRIVTVPVRDIADRIAAEWEAQREIIDPLTMPLTRFANSVVEAVVDRAELVRDDVAKYLHSDLLFYRAGYPEALAVREAAHWDGVLFWAAEQLGAHFILTEGIVHVRQPEPAVEAARAALPSDPWSIAALHVVTTMTGSALLALALLHRVRDPDQVWAAAHVDEDWNTDQWGVDEEVAARRAARLVDFWAAVTILQALNTAAGLRVFQNYLWAGCDHRWICRRIPTITLRIERVFLRSRRPARLLRSECIAWGSRVIDLAKAAIWPAVVLLILFLFYSPIRRTLDSLAQQHPDEIQTIKLGSLEINVRARDLPLPKPEVADVLRLTDAALVAELFSNQRGGGNCYYPDENNDPRFKTDSRLAELGLAKMEKNKSPPSFCPHSYDYTVTTLGHDSLDFLLKFVSVEIGGSK